jgi:hypothetical protein
MRNKLVDRKVFLKGELYMQSNPNVIVMCTKTTCNYSSDDFSGIVIEAEDYPKGHYSKEWFTSTFIQKI